MRKTGSTFTALVTFFTFIVLTASSFTSEIQNNPGTFTCMVNDKPFMLENVKATRRNTTGGRIQISLSNDRFVKFFFIDPKVKDFDLSGTEAREAIIRYSEPGTGLIYSPKSGHVTITQLDEHSRTISGTFTMELTIPGKDKVIKVTKGEFTVPIVAVR